jgi:hypothetical protein
MHKESIETEVFDPRSICIATATFYKKWYPGPVINSESDIDKVRGDLALELFAKAKVKGYQLVNIDGGSSAQFMEELNTRHINWKKEMERGMSPSRRQAFREASVADGVKVIAWTEPEKIDFVANSLENLALPIIKGGADIVIPYRTEKVFTSYPEFQMKSEKRLNKDWNDVLRHCGLIERSAGDFDVSFGPKLFKNSQEILSLFLARYEVRSENSSLSNLVKPDSYSNATFFPVIAALNMGYRVVSVEVDDFEYPEVQAGMEKDSEDFRKKRQKQRTDIVSGAIEFCRFLKNDIKSRLRKI